jgi:hypothetical protein
LWCFVGGWLGYEIARFVFGDRLFSVRLYSASSFAGSVWCTHFFFLFLVFFFSPLEIGYKATRVFDSGWIELGLFNDAL